MVGSPIIGPFVRSSVRRHGEFVGWFQTYRTAALCSEDWQKRKRTSRRPLLKAYLLDMVGAGVFLVVCDRRALGSEGERNRSRERLLLIAGLWLASFPAIE